MPRALLFVVIGFLFTHQALAEQAGCFYLTTRAGRGHQLHTGAQQASGSVLWFLHADAEPSARSLESIRRAVRAGALGGYFRFRFTGRPARLNNFPCYTVSVNYLST